MTKIEQTKNETLDNQIQVWEKIETIYPEIIQTPDYGYWVNQNTIDWQVAIRNLNNWWWKYYCWSFVSPLSVWNYSITWIWFKPKMIIFQAIYSSNNGSMSWWQTNWVNSWAFFHFYLNWTPYYDLTSAVIYVRNSSGTTTSASFVSCDNDWFTINFLNAWFKSNIHYQCYW